MRMFGDYCFEYYPDEHIYLVDGVILPSITHILGSRFSGKYSGVSAAVLKRAADAGTAVHEAIERWCKTGEESDLPELRGFKTLKRLYGFEVVDNEVPVILSVDGAPAACGRLDLVLRKDGKIGGADIKRTSSLDKEYLAYQLNLYRIAYRQTYGVEWKFLYGLHLRGETRRLVEFPINEAAALDLVREYQKGQENEQSVFDWQNN